MPEPPCGEAEEGARSPRGTIRHGWFAGILEGRVGSRDALERAVHTLNASSPVQADLEIDGARFSVLFDETAIAGEQITEESLGILVDDLQAIIGTAEDPGAVESTVRCTLVTDQETIETLFAPLEGRIKTVSRPRPIEPSDEERAPRPAARLPLDGMGTRRAVMAGGLLLVGLLILAWSSGLIDRLLGAAVEGLELRGGPFEGLLAIEVESSWGDYRVQVERGPAYPDDLAAAETLRTGARTAVDRAAINAVANGEGIYVQLRDAAGKVLTATRVELRALLTKADGKVTAHLPGRIGAAAIELALDSGMENR